MAFEGTNGLANRLHGFHPAALAASSRIHLSGDKIAFVFQAREALSIDAPEFRFGTVTTAADLKVSVQGVDASTGFADGVISHWAIIPAIAQISNTWCTTPPVTSDGTPSGTRPVFTQGQKVAYVIEFASTVGDINLSRWQTSGGVTSFQCTFTDIYSASAWTRGGFQTITCIALRLLDGSYRLPHRSLPALSVQTASGASTGQNLTSATTPDEVGLRFTPEVRCRLKGVQFFMQFGTVTGGAGSGGDHDFILTTDDGTVIDSTFQDGDQTADVANAYYYYQPFLTRPILVPGKWYRLTVRPRTTESMGYFFLDFPKQGVADAFHGGKMMGIDRVDAGAWNERPLRLPAWELQFDGLAADAIPTVDDPDGDGVPDIGTDPADPDTLCGATTPLLWFDLQKDSGFVRYSWVDQPIPLADKLADPRILAISSIRRAIDWRGRYVPTDFDLTLWDGDGSIRALILANDLLDKRGDLWMQDDADRRLGGDPSRMGQFGVYNYKTLGDRTVRLSLRDTVGLAISDDQRSILLPRIQLARGGVTDDLPIDLEGMGAPIPYGIVSDEAFASVTGVLGVGQVFYAGTELLSDGLSWYVGLFAGCATRGPVSVFGSDGGETPQRIRLNETTLSTDVLCPGLDMPAAVQAFWSSYFPTAQYRVKGGRRVMLMYFRPGSVVGEAFKTNTIPVVYNGGGIEDVGDCTGNVITSAPLIALHLQTNFIEQDHNSDADWFTIPTVGSPAYATIRGSSFQDVADVTADRAAAANADITRTSFANPTKGYEAAFIIGHDLKRIPASDWIARICEGNDFQILKTRQGQTALTIEDPSGSVVRAFEEIPHVWEGSFAGPDKQRNLIARTVTCKAIKSFRFLVPNIDSNVDFTGAPFGQTEWLQPKRSVGSGFPPYPFEHWTSQDWTIAQIEDVQTYILARSENGPDFYSFMTSLCGLDVEPGSLFTIQHSAALVSTPRLCRCLSVELVPPAPDVEEWGVRLVGYDITDL